MFFFLCLFARARERKEQRKLSVFVYVCPERQQTNSKIAYKSMDDKHGNYSPEGVIIELTTNDGNVLQEIIILSPLGT